MRIDIDNVPTSMWENLTANDPAAMSGEYPEPSRLVAVSAWPVKGMAPGVELAISHLDLLRDLCSYADELDTGDELDLAGVASRRAVWDVYGDMRAKPGDLLAWDGIRRQLVAAVLTHAWRARGTIDSTQVVERIEFPVPRDHPAHGRI